jgi:sulfinoalanine decarboxylase
MCNFLLLKQKNLLHRTCANGDNTYIFRDDETDLGVASLQCGRRVDSLKWFLDWKFFTRKGFADRVENYHRLAQFAEDLINQSESLEMAVKRTSFNVCFTFKNAKNEFIQHIREYLHQQQQALLSLAYIDNRLIFRLLISNTNVNKTSLTQLFDHLVKTQRELINA